MARSRPLSGAPRGVNRAANKAADPAPMSLLLADAGARPAELRRPADIAAQLIEQAQALFGPQRMPWVLEEQQGHHIAAALLACRRNAVALLLAVTPWLDEARRERHPLRILLAEDNVVNQKLAMRLLQQMGYRAGLASNGVEAIECCARQPYDVVLMDVQMPEMDGLEASRRITAKWKQHERQRIVAMTANAMQGDREECLAAGMDDYVTKPIRVDALVEALNQVKTRHEH